MAKVPKCRRNIYFGEFECVRCENLKRGAACLYESWRASERAKEQTNDRPRETGGGGGGGGLPMIATQVLCECGWFRVRERARSKSRAGEADELIWRLIQ